MMKQQVWSTKALAEIQEVMAQKTSDEKSKIKTHCKKAAGLIQRSGLIQALCFLRARTGKDMGDYFCDALARVYGANNAAELSDRAQRASLPEYLMMTRDCIEVAIWFRRFAQIEMVNIKEESNQD